MFSHSFNKKYFIAGLFAATTLLTLFFTTVAGFAVSAAGFFVTDIPVQTAPPLPRSSENLRIELNSALAPEMPFSFDMVGNPFSDSTGVSLTLANQPGNASGKDGISGGVSPAFSTFPQATGRVNNIPPPSNFSVASSSPQNTAVTTILPEINSAEQPLSIYNSTESVRERNRQIKLGREVPALETYYAIDELRPYGIVGTGGKNRVKLLSTTNKARIAVLRGTRFKDGTIESISDDGVVFRRDSGEIVVKRWAKNKDSGTIVAADPSAPVMRVERSAPVPQISDNSPR